MTTEQHLFNPDGGLVAVLPASASHETILRAAYALAPRDLIAAAEGDDSIDLVVFAMEEKPQGDLIRPLGVSLPLTQRKEAERRLMELAVLDLWDRGWSMQST
ncbi:hypothetical protein [Aquabacterium sp.]|uniref:hypothetical protein n=1 Tax=Aquabacterium sp. TaxID=1872578 RepID=UPI0035B27989